MQHPPAPPPPQAKPDAAEPEEPGRKLRRWGWGLAASSLVIPLLVIGAAVFGWLVISRGEGRSTRAGVAIIVVAVVLALLSIKIWASYEA